MAQKGPRRLAVLKVMTSAGLTLNNKDGHNLVTKERN
jgi:hypothetical protein